MSRQRARKQSSHMLDGGISGGVSWGPRTRPLAVTTLVVPLGARGPEEAGSESQASLLYLYGRFPLLIRDRPTQAVHVPGICFLGDYPLASTANCRAMSSWENQGHRLARRLPEKSDSSASSWPVAPLGHVTALTNVTKKSQGRKVIHGPGWSGTFSRPRPH